MLLREMLSGKQAIAMETSHLTSTRILEVCLPEELLSHTAKKELSVSVLLI